MKPPALATKPVRRRIHASWLAAVCAAAALVVALPVHAAERSRFPNPRYVPDDMPLAETAVLSVWDDTPRRHDLGVAIETLDGEEFKALRGYPNSGFLVRLRPGRHRLGLRYMHMVGGLSSFDQAKPFVDIEVEAGKVYVLRVVRIEDRVDTSLEEFKPGTPYRFPYGAAKDSSMEGLFEEGQDPRAEARKQKNAARRAGTTEAARDRD